MRQETGLRQACIALVLAQVALAPAAGAKDMYRWVDADGSVYFSDSPPIDLAPEDYEGPRPKTVREALEEEAEARRQAALEERQARRREARARALAPEASTEKAVAPADEIEVDSPYDCDQAKRFHEHYANLREPQFRPAPEGGFRRITPEELADQVRQWEEAVRLLCRETPPSTDS